METNVPPSTRTQSGNFAPTTGNPTDDVVEYAKQYARRSPECDAERDGRIADHAGLDRPQGRVEHAGRLRRGLLSLLDRHDHARLSGWDRFGWGSGSQWRRGKVSVETTGRLRPFDDGSGYAAGVVSPAASPATLPVTAPNCCETYAVAARAANAAPIDNALLSSDESRLAFCGLLLM